MAKVSDLYENEMFECNSLEELETVIGKFDGVEPIPSGGEDFTEGVLALLKTDNRLWYYEDHYCEQIFKTRRIVISDDRESLLEREKEDTKGI